jgi:flagellar motor switch protein FliN/FliY
MTDDIDPNENTPAEDDGQINEDDWASAMMEQTVSESQPQITAQPADIFPSLAGNAG